MHLPDLFRFMGTSMLKRAGTFGTVSSLAAAAVAATAILDIVTGAATLSTELTWLLVVLAAAVSSLPLLIARSFRPWMALTACWVFGAVTIALMALTDDTIVAVNNLVLYPMIASYLGWFFNRSVARLTIGVILTGSIVSLMAAGHTAAMSSWANLAVASVFCLEASGYLRHRLDGRIETDPLTGALNRAGWARVCRQSMTAHHRAGLPLTIAVVDFDDFKVINDTLGHAAGDQVLVDFVAQISRQQRIGDRVARLGGDEFGLILAGTPVENAGPRLNRLRQAAEATWSFGAAEATPDDTVETLLARADQHLYAMKRTRRLDSDGLLGH